jgi:hypothetical protein
MDNITNMPQIAHSFESVVELSSAIDAGTDQIAWTLKNYPVEQAEQLIEDMLGKLQSLWKGDADEFRLRREWLRGELLRRLRQQ